MPTGRDATCRQRNGIATVRGADMHAPETHVRLTFGSDEEVLGELLRGLAQACRESASWA